MFKPITIILIVGSGISAILVLTAVVLYLSVDIAASRSRIEEAVSDALGMEAGMGRLDIGLFPSPHVELDTAYVRNLGTEIISAEEVRLGIDPLPLLRREVRIRSIALQQPTISIERDRDGRFNFERQDTDRAPSPAWKIAKLSLANATFLYTDKRSGKEQEAADCNLELRDLHKTRAEGQSFMQNLSFSGTLACGKVLINDLAFSDLQGTALGRNGVFELNPVNIIVADARGSGVIRAEFSGDVPLYHIRFSLPDFHIEEFIKRLSPQQAAEGTMDFSADLSMRGRTLNEMKQTMKGTIILQGGNLTLIGRDLDQTFARYESSQNFNLVDVGALFFAGPAGLAVTKGYKFASLFQGPGGSTIITRLFSSWKVGRGIAQAQDVAMATNENRIALKGNLDLVNERFDNLIVALIDNNGCVKMEQAIHGSFLEPVVEKPTILESLTGPARELLQKGKDLIIGGECEVFYNGSVAAPK